MADFRVTAVSGLLLFFLRVFRLVQRPFLVEDSVSWCIGPTEVAGLLRNYSDSIEGSVSVCLEKN